MKRWTTTKTTVAGVLAACLLCCTTAQAKKPPKPPGGGGGTVAPYTVVDLNGLPIAGRGDYVQSTALSVNEPDGSGAVQVVGDSYTGTSPEHDLHPALWEVDADGGFTITDLGLPPLAREAAATDVNDWGVITINTTQSYEFQNGQLILPAWVSVPGLPLQLLPFDSHGAVPMGINNFNEIAGTHANGNGAWWQLDAEGVPGDPVDLGGGFAAFLPSDISDSDAAGIADSGVAAGWHTYKPALAYFVEGVLVVEPLDSSRGAATGMATAISPDGVWVVGWLGAPAGSGDEMAFRWSATTGITELGRVGGDASVALGVNNAGQVVGWSNTGDRRHPETAFLWQDGQMSDLDSLADTGGKVQLLEATEINNAGHVVGSMEITSGKSSELHAFVLIPKKP